MRQEMLACSAAVEPVGIGIEKKAHAILVAYRLRDPPRGSPKQCNSWIAFWFYAVATQCKEQP